MVLCFRDKYKVKNEFITLEIDAASGLITSLCPNLEDTDIADKCGLGASRYTLKSESIETDRPFTAYADKFAKYDKVYAQSEKIVCEDTKLRIKTEFSLENDTLIIKSSTANDDISRLGVDLNFNFLGKNNGTCEGQLLPTSPYSSDFINATYCIMPVIGKGFCTVASKSPEVKWKTDYSPYSFGHYINGFQFLYSPRAESLDIAVFFAKSEKECFEKLSDFYSAPIILPSLTGTFSNKLNVEVTGKCDKIGICAEEKEATVSVRNGKAEIEVLCYGRHRLIPYFGGVAGLECEVWFGEDADLLFKKSCDSTKKPYHGDENLCEGGIWLHSLLCFMNHTGNLKYLGKVKAELESIMGENGERKPRKTLLSYASDGYPAYHICKSKRVQEQFSGISILCEAYKLTKDGKYLDFAVKCAKTAIETYLRDDGAIFTESDYTTVCAPIIPIIDLALIMKFEGCDEDYAYFAEASSKIASYLVKRGMTFPTEGIKSPVNDEEIEEGSVSCTALSILYYCRYIEKRDDYIDFAEKILDFHENFVCKTPDVKLYRSTMRWWETIWEGDGTGPSVCAGHAWSIWRAEADYHMGILTGKREYLVKSLCGFMTNFSKITKDGHSFACYQPDFYPGGGDCEIRKSLLHLSSEDIPKNYTFGKGYPNHFDNSLSRYVWVRACATWLKDGFSSL